MKSRRKYAALGGALVLASSLALSACGSSENKSGTSGAKAQDLKIAFGSLSNAQPIFKSVNDGLEKAVNAQGGKFISYDNKVDPAAAIANVRLMIQQKPDVIVEWIPEPAAGSVSKLIAASKIPCIAVNVAIEGCSFFNLSNAQAGKDLGAVAAEEATSRGWGAGNLTVVTIAISVAGPDIHKANTEFYSTFASSFPEMEQVKAEDISFTTTKIGDFDGYQVDSQGTLDSAYKSMQQVLQIVPKGRHLVVQAQNDDSARGALRAIEQAGRADDVIIAGGGADAGALDALRNTEAWFAEGDPSVPRWPGFILAMSQALVAGDQLPDLTPAPQVVLTKKNIDEYYDGSTPKANLPIPDGAKYLTKYFDN